MSLRKLHIILLLTLASLTSPAQQFPLTTQYLFNLYALTPSMAGVTGYSELFVNYRSDWTKFEGHPRTFRINGFGNVYQEKMWVGGEMYMDKSDILSRFKANISYTYKLQVENEQFIHFAVWGSFYQNVANYADATGVDPNDPLFQNLSKITASKMNAGFGINYNWRDLNAGFSIPTLFASRQEIENSQGITFAFKQEYLFHLSYLFHITNDFDLQAFSVFRKTTNEPLNLELSVMAVFMQRFWAGVLFRKGGALALNVGGNLVKGLVFNYSYEIGMAGIHAHSGGSHEITLGWRFGFNHHDKYFKFKNSGSYQGHTKTNRYKNSRNDYPPVYDYRYRKIKR